MSDPDKQCRKCGLPQYQCMCKAIDWAALEYRHWKAQIDYIKVAQGGGIIGAGLELARNHTMGIN